MAIVKIPAVAPRYAERLIPATIDHIASKDPNRVFASIPRTSDLSDGFRDITYFELARAIDRAAWWIEARHGRSENFETLGYMGLLDIRYFIILVGACKAGYKTILPSPRNSPEAQINLFKLTSCKTLLTSKDYALPPNLLSLSSVDHIEIQSLENFLSPPTTSKTPNGFRNGTQNGTHAKDDKPYPYTKTFEEAKNDPFLVIHTSGSTGLPKPIILKHSWMCTLDTGNLLSETEDGFLSALACMRGLKVYCAMPAFHAVGICFSLAAPVFENFTTIWGPPDRPTSSILAEEMIDHGKPDMILCAPSILEELINDDVTKGKLESLSIVGFAGGPLSQKSGDKICQQVRIVNMIGSTESSHLPTYVSPPTAWSYLHYNPLHTGITFHPQGDGTYELIMKRDPTTDKFHSVFSTLPEADEYGMNDLYIPHPSKKGLWKHVGRKDDVIALSNGEKVNPTGMERGICECEGVKSCLVVGQGRFDVGAILEVSEEVRGRLKGPEDKSKWIEDVVWPFVVEVNKLAPSHGQLAVDKIMLSDPQRPFLKTPKGSVRRSVTVKLYEDFIERLYLGEEDKEVEGGEKEMIDLGLDTPLLEQELGNLMEDLVGVKGLEKDQDMFNAGMDSLHVMKITKRLKASSIKIKSEKINARLIYANPTISSLASDLKQISTTNNDADGDMKTLEEIAEETLQKYIAELPSPSTRARKVSNSRTILLTGSTGSLGSYLLHVLLSSPKTSKIFCLNRKPDAQEIQAKGNAQKELTSSWDDRVEFLHANLSKPSLGLSEKDYERLRDEVDVIIHNQWQVDFNLSLPTFTPHILGTLHLITLSSQTPTHAPLYFTSSIGTIQRFPSFHPHTLIPEESLTDPRFPLQQGYSISKWITERLLDAARERSGVSSAVLRVGQIAGPVEVGRKGAWNRSEWVPSLIASSKFLGVVPGSLPGMDGVPWVPVDLVARIIGELVDTGFEGEEGGREEAWTKYFHLCNPEEGNWRDLVGVVQEYFGGEIEVVGFEQWLERLKGSVDGMDGDAEKNPGVKLLEFYEQMVKTKEAARLDTRKTREASDSMRNLKCVGGEWMRQWLEQWNF